MKAAVVAVHAVALLALGCAHPTETSTDLPASATDSAPGSTSISNPGDDQTEPAGGGSDAGVVPTDPTTPAGPARCHSSDLTATLRLDGAAAGNRYATLALTNGTSHPCRVFGYGGLQLLDADRRPVPTRQYRDPTQPPTLVTVTPGHSVSTLLHWGAVPSGSEPEQGQCEPEASFLSVIPPDETTALVVDWTGGPVCEQGRIAEWAYQSGPVTPR